MSNWNRVQVVTAPETPVDNLVSLADLRAFLSVGDEVGDVELTRFLRSAVAMIDGPQGIGYAILSQTWRLTLDHFPCEIRLPGAPIKSVTSIKYIDTEGTEQTLAPEKYRAVNYGGEFEISPAYGLWWPVPRCVEGAVTIEYVVGEETGADVNPRIVDLICLVIGARDKFREAVTVTTGSVQVLPLSVQTILDDFRQIGPAA